MIQIGYNDVNALPLNHIKCYEKNIDKKWADAISNQNDTIKLHNKGY